MSPTNVGHNQLLSPAAPRWADILGPFFEEIERRQARVAREAVAQVLAQQASDAAEKEKSEELLNDQQAADLLGVKRKTVFSWKQKGLLPSHRLGGRIFYKRGEVLAALEASTQPDGRRKYARRGKPNEQSR